jgi:hypothetical protein
MVASCDLYISISLFFKKIGKDDHIDNASILICFTRDHRGVELLRKCSLLESLGSLILVKSENSGIFLDLPLPKRTAGSMGLFAGGSKVFTLLSPRGSGSV